jgi:hypothetical protein
MGRFVKLAQMFVMQNDEDLVDVILVHLEIDLKNSCNRPGVAQRVPGNIDSQISMTFGT